MTPLKGKKSEYSIFLILNFFCFSLYTKNIFLDLVVCVRVRIYYILVYNLALLAILIFMQLVSAIIYNRYSSKYATVIKN